MIVSDGREWAQTKWVGKEEFFDTIATLPCCLNPPNGLISGLLRISSCELHLVEEMLFFFRNMKISRHFSVPKCSMAQPVPSLSVTGVNISHYSPLINGEKFVILTDLANKQGKVKPNMPILTGKSLPLKCKMFTPDRSTRQCWS